MHFLHFIGHLRTAIRFAGTPSQVVYEYEITLSLAGGLVSHANTSVDFLHGANSHILTA